VRRAALAAPDVSFVFIGPATRAFRRAAAGLANVRVLGFRRYGDIAPYVRAFDVGIVPFARNDLTGSADPLKLYEYRAAGLGAVATPFNGLVPRPGVVAVAGTPEDFAQAVRAMACAGRDHWVRRRRAEVARNADWSKRLDAFEGLIQSRLAAPTKTSRL
jgi:hypothetical protein